MNWYSTAVCTALLLACSSPGTGSKSQDTEQDSAPGDSWAPDASDPSDGQGPEEEADAVSLYPLDDVLRVNHIQCKGTHNSTHIEPEFAVEEWLYTHEPLPDQLEVHGIRQVELDVHYTAEGTFDVYHLPVLDQETTCGTLSGCLGELKAWSDAHPRHHLLFVLVEPKDELDFQRPIVGHYDELDQAILDVWPPERVMLPDDVRGEHATLRDALVAEGWPTLGETRQMAMFIMLDNEQHRDAYLAEHPNLEGRVLFARGGVGEPWASVLEGGSAEERLAAAEEGYLVRGSADSTGLDDEANSAKAAQAMAGPAHFISSDFPYAQGEGYWFDLTGGVPSRCNPVTAPPACRAEDIE